MSDFQPNPGSGYIFVNKDKAEPKPNKEGVVPNTEKWPDWKGSVNVDGKVMALALWKSKTKNGEPMFSAKISEFKMPESVKQAAETAPAEDLDSIPW